MRSISIGTQLIPPSENAILSFGKRVGTCAQSQSAAVTSALTGKRLVYNASGAPGDRAAVHDDEPLCRQTTVSVSSHARSNGSQCGSIIGGSFRSTGFSGKLTALNPRAALAYTSSAATFGSLVHASCSGMIRSGCGPYHSSKCQ